MKQKMSIGQTITNFFKYNWFRFLLAIALAAACLITYCVTYSDWVSPIVYVNGLFIGGALCIGVSLMSVVLLFGFLDIFSYYFNRKTTENGKEDLYEYSERKKSLRMKNPLNFLPYLFIGVVAIIISVILNY
ncbi:MAG: DUF3899 domain-containing protein [Bacilli bacterium]|nr:DUF3899 domain-containing protein [Bacilli bacterium]